MTNSIISLMFSKSKVISFIFNKQTIKHLHIYIKNRIERKTHFFELIRVLIIESTAFLRQQQ